MIDKAVRKGLKKEKKEANGKNLSHWSGMDYYQQQKLQNVFLCQKKIYVNAITRKGGFISLFFALVESDKDQRNNGHLQKENPRPNGRRNIFYLRQK